MQYMYIFIIHHNFNINVSWPCTVFYSDCFRIHCYCWINMPWVNICIVVVFLWFLCYSQKLLAAAAAAVAAASAAGQNKTSPIASEGLGRVESFLCLLVWQIIRDKMKMCITEIGMECGWGQQWDGMGNRVNASRDGPSVTASADERWTG